MAAPQGIPVPSNGKWLWYERAFIPYSKIVNDSSTCHSPKETQLLVLQYKCSLDKVNRRSVLAEAGVEALVHWPSMAFKKAPPPLG
jgi:hypothetical protein